MDKRKVLITGASRGIGRAIAVLLAKQYHLILHASKEESLHSLLEELGKEHQILCADFTDVEGIKQFCKQLKKIASSDLHGIINNAGISIDKPLMYQSLDTMDVMLNVNVKAPLLVSKTALKIFFANKEGVIINIGSCVGETGNAFQVVYSMTKAAMTVMTKSIAKEIAAIDKTNNIRSVTISPGFIETNMTKELSDEVRGTYLEMIPSNRFGNPIDIANTVAFVLSDQAQYINGTNIAVNGGIV